MTNFVNIESALTAINNEAAQDAWDWLEREKPQTAKAIQYLVEVAKMKPDKVLDILNEVYGDSEPNARHKMKLVVGALVGNRDD
jgi:hypothetical protein